MTDKIRTINLYEDDGGKVSAELTDKQPHRVIYLQWANHADWDSITWCQDRTEDDDVAYIRRDIFRDVEMEAAQLRRQLEEKS